ncbi:MAG: hypothetical protein J7K81_03740 [Methanophagales archaeon]|nr:hypothetical protein [Methanophagales archaeon]
MELTDELYLYFTGSHVTSDFIVDCLGDFWLTVQARFPQIKTLLLNQDNGPQNHSRRTQFMKRIIEFTDEFQLTTWKSGLYAYLLSHNDF